MSAHSFIKTFSTLTENIENIDELIKKELKDYGVEDIYNKQLGSLSKGQKMKINIISSFLTPSKNLLLDEPLSGLDPDSKKVLLKKIKEDDRCIIIISHETNQFRKKDFITLRIENGVMRDDSEIN